MKKTCRSVAILLCLLAFLFPFSVIAHADTAYKDIVMYNGGFLLLKPDGTVEVRFDRECNYTYFDEDMLRVVAAWKNITALVCTESIIAGLRADGKVEAVGLLDDAVAQIRTWSDVSVLIGAARNVIGLRSDGTVVAAGDDVTVDFREDGIGIFTKITWWTGVKKIVAGTCAQGEYVVGLRSDGTILHEGVQIVGPEFDRWTGTPDNIIDIACSGWSLLGLKSDGTAVLTGVDINYLEEDVSTWSDLKQVICGDTSAVGLKQDGTVVLAPAEAPFVAPSNVTRLDSFGYYQYMVAYLDNGRLFFFPGFELGRDSDLVRTAESWENVQKVDIGCIDHIGESIRSYLIGLTNDGRLLTAGFDPDELSLIS
jgi:hypothetical protein